MIGIDLKGTFNLIQCGLFAYADRHFIKSISIAYWVVFRDKRKSLCIYCRFKLTCHIGICCKVVNGFM
jgi:hypothetical protein